MRDIQKEITGLVSENRVVLFMKGNKLMPQCGFSAMAVQIVGSYTDKFLTVNVLQDMEIRAGIKEYGNWPTIPQCYVDGDLLGGSDILRELHTSGELAEIFGNEPALS
jgi:monothiol glutaredoxin